MLPALHLDEVLNNWKLDENNMQQFSYTHIPKIISKMEKGTNKSTNRYKIMKSFTFIL